MKLWVFVASMIVGLAIIIVAVERRDSAALPSVENKQNPVAAHGKRTPVIVELFTSEGCSSCPPADDVLARLERTQPIAGAEVIALAEHVDYWNRLGWTDPYSHASFSQRQGDYAHFFGRDGVYTPQMIVDGQTEFPGGNRDRATSAIAAAAQIPKTMIEITPRVGNPNEQSAETISLLVKVGKLPVVSAGDVAEVMLAITESNLSSKVERGENAGRRLTHPSTVRWLASLGMAKTEGVEGDQAFTAEPSVNIARGWRHKNLRAVVFVQERASRRVLGAQAISLASG